MRASRCICCAGGRCSVGPARAHKGCHRPDPDNLNTVGGKLKNLPQGWKFETKVLTENLSLDTGRAGGWAAIIRDDLGNTYQGCGYGKDTNANYVP